MAKTAESSVVWRFDFSDLGRLRGVSFGLEFPIWWRRRYSAEVRRIGGEGGKLMVSDARNRVVMERTVHVPQTGVSRVLAAGWVKQVARFLNHYDNR